MFKFKLANALLLISFLIIVFPRVFAFDKIVAVVNNDAVTQKDLNDFVKFMRLQLANQFQGKELEEKVNSMKLDLLNRLIEDRLILQEARKLGMKINEDMVKGRLAEIRKAYPTEAAFNAALAKDGLVQADIETKIREQFLTYGCIEQNVRSKIVVNPNEVTAYYEGHKQEIRAAQVKEYSNIILEDQDMARSLSYDLKRGEKIEDLAVRYIFSIDKLSVAEGESLRPDVDAAIRPLNLNEASEPVRIDDKFYVFILDNIIPSRQLSLFESQDKVYEIVFQNKMGEQLDKWLNEIKKKSYIKIVAD